MRNFLRSFSRESLLLVFLSALSLLFFVNFKENTIYQIAGYGSPFREYVRVSIPFFLQMGFLGISVGILFERKFGRKFEVKFESQLLGLSYLVLLTATINFIILPQNIFTLLALLVWAFGVGSVYGFCYGTLLNTGSKVFTRSLFVLMLGSAMGLAAHNLFFSVLPHVAVYFVLFFLIRLLGFRGRIRTSSADLILVAIMAVVLAQMPSWGQRIFSTDVLACRGCQIEKIRDRNGTTDIVFNPAVGSYTLYADLTSPTTIAKKGEIESVEPQALLPYNHWQFGEVLILGAGGGQDIVAALHFGANHVDAVEINKLRVQLMKGRFRDFSNELFFDPKVRVHVQSARQYLRESAAKFDLILIQRPWTMLVTNSYFYDLSSELFKIEALEEYISALRINGKIFFILPYFSYIPFNLDQALRKVTSARAKSFCLFRYGVAPKQFLGALVASEADVRNFMKNEKDVVWLGSSFDEKENNVRPEGQAEETLNDKQITAPLVANQSAVVLGIITLFVALFVGSLLIGRTQELTYFYLGIGFELTLITFIFWFPLFSSNFSTILPYLFISFFLLSGIGYLVAPKLGKTGVTVVTVALGLVFFGLSGSHFLAGIDRLSLFSIASPLYLAVAVAVALPFGYLISSERNISKALFIDYLGALSSIFIFLLIPNLNHLVIICGAIYILVGASLWRKRTG